MKDTARKKDRRQEAPRLGQLAMTAMLDARSTLYSTIMNVTARLIPS